MDDQVFDEITEEVREIYTSYLKKMIDKINSGEKIAFVFSAMEGLLDSDDDDEDDEGGDIAGKIGTYGNIHEVSECTTQLFNNVIRKTIDCTPDPVMALEIIRNMVKRIKDYTEELLKENDDNVMRVVTDLLLSKKERDNEKNRKYN